MPVHEVYPNLVTRDFKFRHAGAVPDRKQCRTCVATNVFCDVGIGGIATA